MLAFGVAVFAYNVLAVLQAADIELSPYYLGSEIKAQYTGMMTAVIALAWQAYDALTSQQLGRVLLKIAIHADPMVLRKHSRCPKKPRKKGYVCGAAVRRHMSPPLRF